MESFYETNGRTLAGLVTIATVVEVADGMPEYQALSAQELADLSAEAGRELSQRGAYEYIKRARTAGAVDHILEHGVVLS